jgi:hypothetical protein
MVRRQLLEHDTAQRRQRALTTFVGQLRPKSIVWKMSYRLGSARGGTLTMGWGMTILLVQPTAGASRSIPRARATPGRRLWAHRGRIVESRFRVQCDYFFWNSEVGRRSLGIQSFWFQKVCQNHLVWDAIEVVEFKRKHTANVHEGLSEIRRIVETLVTNRDKRRDGFVKVIRQAMQTKLGDVADEVARRLASNGISKAVASEALEIAERKGGFTIFALVDALTQLAQKVQFAADRTEADQVAASLFALAV